MQSQGMKIQESGSAAPLPRKFSGDKTDKRRFCRIDFGEVNDMSLSRRMRRERRRDLAAIAVILIFAFLVVSGSAVGNFMAEKVIAPLMALTEKDGGRAKENEGTVTLTVTPNVPAVFAVSAGTFPDGKIPAAEEKLKALNGAAYPLKEDAGTALLFGCFASRSSAEKTANGLTGTFPETVIRTLSAEVPAVRLTGSPAQTQTIADGFSLLADTVSELLSCTDGLCEGDLTRLQASVKLKEKEAALGSVLASLRELATTHATVRALREAVLCLKTLLEDLPESTDDGFIRRVRYTSAAAAWEYVDFLTKL